MVKRKLPEEDGMSFGDCDSSMNLRLPSDLRREVMALAKANGRSFSGEIRWAMQRHVEAQQAPSYRFQNGVVDLRGQPIPRIDNVVPD